jgi:hypothetical protein
MSWRAIVELRKDKSRRDLLIKQRKSAAQVTDPDGGFIFQIIEAVSHYNVKMTGTIHPSSRHFVKGIPLSCQTSQK